MDLRRTALRAPLADALAGPTRVPRLAQVVLALVLLGLGFAALLSDLQQKSSPGRLALIVIAMLAILAIQVVFFGGQMHRDRPRATIAALVIQGVLVWAPMLILGYSWLGQVGFFVGSLLIAAPLRLAGPACAAMLFLVGQIALSATDNWLSTLYAVDATVITGLVVFGLTTLARFVVELHQARAELAARAVTTERERFARDLHDLLGYSLSAITLKSELVRSVVHDQPCRAQDELSELIDISRQALKDVRRVARQSRCCTPPESTRESIRTNLRPTRPPTM
jgi:two-component system, NarL family, sensor histidine kinase DesK